MNQKFFRLPISRHTAAGAAFMLSLIGLAALATAELGHTRREALDSFRAGTDAIDTIASWQQHIGTTPPDMLPNMFNVIHDGAFKIEDLGAGLSQAEAVRGAAKRAAANPNIGDAAITLEHELGSIRNQIRNQAEQRALDESDRAIRHIFLAWIAVLGGATVLWLGSLFAQIKRIKLRAPTTDLNP